MKQQFNIAKQELSHSLYQHDAACRVIARLMKEKDELKSSLKNLKPTSSTEMEVEEAEEIGLTKDVLNKFIATSEELSSKRKHRELSPNLKKPAEISAFTHKSSYPLHTSSIKSVDVHLEKNLILTAGEDGNAVIFNKEKSRVVSTLKAGSRAVNTAIFHPIYDLAFTGDADHSIKYWSLANNSCVRNMEKVHTNEVTGLSLQATGDYLASCSFDKKWALCDISTGTTLTRQQGENRLTCIQFHPDGLIFGTGNAESGSIQIWDIKSQQVAAKLDKHKASTTHLSFSENGYYLASSSSDNSVKIWDLRKLDCIQSLEFASSVRTAVFDYSGVYLGVGCDDGSVNIYQSKVWTSLCSIPHAHNGPVNGLAFGKDASFVITVSSDQNLKIFQ
jgi:pre-mRNA-processing factor 19